MRCASECVVQCGDFGIGLRAAQQQLEIIEKEMGSWTGSRRQYKCDSELDEKALQGIEDSRSVIASQQIQSAIVD